MNKIKEIILSFILSILYEHENPDNIEDKLQGLSSEYDEHHYMSSIVYRDDTFCIAICTFAGNTGDPYMLVYNYEYEEYSTKCARISMVESRYLKTHSSLFKLKWNLNKKDIDKLIKILNSEPYFTFDKCHNTIWEVMIQRWIDISENNIDHLSIPDYTKLK